MSHSTARSLTFATLLLGLAFFGATASGSTPAPIASGRTPAGPEAPADSGPTVVVPGRPGEPARNLPADKVQIPDDAGYSSTDVWFIRMMIPHHTQAIEMASLAAERAHNPQITAIAERIKAAQLPEILQMRAWLKRHGLSEGVDDQGHDHTTMPGMQSPTAMKALADAKGHAFDRMFVEMMSAHHQGAIDMAGVRLRSGGDLTVERMANAIGFEQEVEITRMRDILGS
jgi:uncharacterized protein (DUF305 family)